ncbi:MAG TPA: hypothetical protein VMF57_09560 [Solirubrobacteraceae bacterium]|nr:hypothetical protein [Solirubrobacteraceae bacterium]
MKGRNRRRRSVWVRLAFVVALSIASHALGGGSAKAAEVGHAPGQETVLAGFTSQNYPAFFKLADDGRRVSVAGIALSMTCTSGDQFVLQDAFAGLRIGANGSLHGSYTQPPTSGQDGATVSATDSLSARLNRRGTQLSGVWQLTAHYAFSDGSADDCASGPVRFTVTG